MAVQDRKPDHDVRVEFEAGEGKEVEERPLKLDKHGLPLVPQPSDHADDPLVRASRFYDAGSAPGH